MNKSAGKATKHLAGPNLIRLRVRPVRVPGRKKILATIVFLFSFVDGGESALESNKVFADSQ